MKKRKYLLLLFFICFMGCNKKYEVKEYEIITVKFIPSVASFWGKSAPYYQYIAVANDGEVISKKTSKFVKRGGYVIFKTPIEARGGEKMEDILKEVEEKRKEYHKVLDKLRGDTELFEISLSRYDKSDKLEVIIREKRKTTGFFFDDTNYISFPIEHWEKLRNSIDKVINKEE